MNANDTQIVRAALATMHRRNQPVGRLAQMKRVCAVHGTVWNAQYREVDGGWKLERCARPSGIGAIATGRASTATVATDFTIDTDLILPGDVETCPWCGCGPKEIEGDTVLHVKCSGCGNIVCLGRTLGSDFRCCDGCGKRGRLGGRFTSYAASGDAEAPRGALAENGGSKALPASSRLKLTNGKTR